MKYPCNPLIIIVFVFLYSCNTKSNDEADLIKMYNDAVKDAMIAEDDEVSYNLIVISKQNPVIVWNADTTHLLVTSLIHEKHKKYYPVGDTVSNWWGDVWVTVVPQLKKRFAKRTDFLDTTLRVKQILGLPPEKEYHFFVDFWIKPEDLFRPAPDNEVDDNYALLDFRENTDSAYIRWFEDQKYFLYNSDIKYPWTRLGYTYDWGNPQDEEGVSEFVVKQNSELIIENVYIISAYFNQ